jgi:hypothetical protein
MSCSLKSLKKWVNEWALEEMSAGVAGRGAEDGWYLCSLQLEFLRAQQADYAGGAADMYKCFDQVNGLMIYTFLDMAGLPDRILKPYMSCIDNFTIFNCFAEHTGIDHKHPVGIPEGCPLSMLIIALSARPWILAMKQQSVIPRVLADDIMVIADSHQASDCENHIDKFVSAFNFTLQYFQHFSARIAFQKSYIFSSHASARCTLKSYFLGASCSHYTCTSA